MIVPAAAIASSRLPASLVIYDKLYLVVFNQTLVTRTKSAMW